MLEYCIQCDLPTGNAGILDDSLYINGQGPYCQICYEYELVWQGSLMEDE